MQAGLKIITLKPRTQGMGTRVGMLPHLLSSGMHFLFVRPKYAYLEPRLQQVRADQGRLACQLQVSRIGILPHLAVIVDIKLKPTKTCSNIAIFPGDDFDKCRVVLES